MVDDRERQLEPLPSTDLVRTLFMEAGDALLIVEPFSERLLDANPMAQRLTRLSRDELLHRSLREVVRHELGASDWLDAVHKTATFHGRDRYLLATDRPDVWVPISLTIARLHPPGTSPLALFTARDQREQVEANRRLRRTETELRRVLVSVSDCLWSSRIDGEGEWHYRYLSPVVERLTGRPVGYFLDNLAAWEQVIVPEDLSRWREFRTRLASGQAAELEYRLRRTDGETAWVRESVVAETPAAGSGDDRLLLHGVMGDVTRRKQAEQAAVERNLLETQKLDCLGVLAGGIAHDFNNLLTAILGSAGLARMECADPSPALPHLDRIETSALRAAELCKQMLAYAGKGRLVVRPLNLSTLVQQSADLLRIAVSRNVNVLFDLASELPPVQADAEQLRQLLTNLLTNASEALSERGGQVRISTGTARPDASLRQTEKYAAGLPEGDCVTLEVSDNGPGMTAEVKARVFEPFFSTRFTGRGLGLAAVLGIVRSHRGAIQVEAEPGLGTTFRIYLPVAPTAPAPATAARPDRGLVLVVDDEESPRGVAALILQSLGFQVLTAAGGREALDLFQRQPETIRLVLLDLTMPEPNGAETLCELRRLRPDLPVVLMSGYSEEEVRGSLGEQEPSAYLEKPFRPTELSDLLGRILAS